MLSTLKRLVEGDYGWTHAASSVDSERVAFLGDYYHVASFVYDFTLSLLSSFRCNILSILRILMTLIKF